VVAGSIVVRQTGASEVSEESGFGGWRLGEEIGRGANSRVYRAERDGRTAVVKVATAKKPASERYQRFVREIESLEALTDEPGVMALIEAEVPSGPGAGGYPWYAMPEAVPLDRALTEAGLEDVVAALAEVAATLSRLHQRGYQHRDVKPQNLFMLGADRFLIGDLGLVSVPDELRRPLTAEGSVIGPANFTAPEMLSIDPTSVDARFADVYSLAKVLWALAAGERYPLPGQQRAGDRRSLVAITDDPRAKTLDTLIERATEHEPERRPSMNEVAAELERWLPTEASGGGDLADLEVAIRGARVELSGAHSAERQRQARRAEAEEAFGLLLVELEPIFAAIPELGTTFVANSSQSPDGTLQFPSVETMGGPQAEWTRNRFDQSLIGGEIGGIRLDVATQATLYDDDVLQLVVGIAVNQLPMSFGSPPFAWAGSREPKLGSMVIRRGIEEVGKEARAAMAEAVGIFAELGRDSGEGI
jgi:serine/threonine protein kinase